MRSKVNNQHPTVTTTTLGRRDLSSELAKVVLLFVQVSTARHCTLLKKKKESPSDHDSPLCKLQDAVHDTVQKCTLLTEGISLRQRGRRVAVPLYPCLVLARVMGMEREPGMFL